MGKIYEVGEEKTTIFGKRTNWDFKQTLEVAGNGDTIELEENFCPSEKSVTINKSITIKGKTKVTDEGKKVFSNVIRGLAIRNGATVTFEDLTIQVDTDRTNNLNVKEASSVICHNVIFKNTATSGQNYPIIFIKDKSFVKLTGCKVAESKIADGKHRIYVEDSKFEITKNYIAAMIHLTNSELTCESSVINNNQSNALFATNSSKVNIQNSKLMGGKLSEKANYPVAMMVDSEGTFKNCSILQPSYDCALDLKKSMVNLESGTYDSLYIHSSQLQVGNITVNESLQCVSKSQIKGNQMKIGGRPNKKINFYANQEAIVNLNELYFGLLSSPNIRLEHNVDFQVKQLKQLEYDSTKNQFILNDNKRYTVVGLAEEIDYFGKQSAYDRLHQLIGIPKVKSEIDEFIAVANMNKIRAEKGLGNSVFTLHSMYLGNPGTGKTTVARIVGELLHEKGIISNDKLVEVSRSDLVGQYIGHTAIKTREKLEEALGGIFFIDEAYTLASESEKDYGREAIDEILKFMEDHRSDIVIIFAGYTDRMEHFLSMNEGLKSRIPNVFNFEDYTIEQLIQIGLKDLGTQNYKVDEVAYGNLLKHNFQLSDDHSNGRWVRNLNERIIRKFALRISEEPDADLSLITQEDLAACRL